ncbi:MAG: hypothetical protein Kow0068_02480 [Marinilabiliales bacterium]
MKDELEKYINKNRDKFDIHEPDENIWEKIDKTIPQRKNIWLKYSYRVAAVAIIFIISYFINNYISNNKKHDKTDYVVNCDVPSDVVETEAYYMQQVNMRMDEIKKYSLNDPQITQEVEYDFSQLDSIYIELKNDLCDNIDNEYVIEAMIQNYRTKLQILEEILYSLKQRKYNENEKINSYTL